MINSKTVLVSGASIAGPALAFWLSKFGFKVTIVERASTQRLGGQNIDISGAARMIVQRMRIEQKIIAASTGELGVNFVDENNIIHQFNEKKYCEEGNINTGILALNKSVFLQKTKHLPQNFSYEKDFLEPNILQIKVTGYIASGYFIDIGIPEDYYKSDRELGVVVNGKQMFNSKY